MKANKVIQCKNTLNYLHLKWVPTRAPTHVLNAFIIILFNMRDNSDINALAKIHVLEKLI